MAKVKVFLKVGQTSRSLDKNFGIQGKSCHKECTYEKYENPTSSG